MQFFVLRVENLEQQLLHEKELKDQALVKLTHMEDKSEFLLCQLKFISKYNDIAVSCARPAHAPIDTNNNLEELLKIRENSHLRVAEQLTCTLDELHDLEDNYQNLSERDLSNTLEITRLQRELDQSYRQHEENLRRIRQLERVNHYQQLRQVEDETQDSPSNNSAHSPQMGEAINSPIGSSLSPSGPGYFEVLRMELHDWMNENDRGIHKKADSQSLPSINNHSNKSENSLLHPACLRPIGP
eukprot:GHVL01019034.1.p2 GENE.GHVL01019034.1~~GHVL01019034.1.p2  ORF type:complete len:243 (+),score=33.98 GHVL01019034.1:296-1024(+)